jgi:hypothetical protein
MSRAIGTTVFAAITLIAAAPLTAHAQYDHAGHDHPPLHVNDRVDDCSVEFSSRLTQASFRRFVREFGSVSAFKQAASASTLRKGRLSIGLELMSFNVDEYSDAWNDTFAHPNDHHPLGSDLDFPKIKARYGITDDADVGAFWARNPNANYGWFGVDGKWRVLSQERGKPLSLAVRGAYTKTLYVSDMDMHAVTADVSVERRVRWGLRPYLGVGADGVLARETSGAVNLRNEAILAPHAFTGVAVTVRGRVDLGLEFTAGPRPSTQIQVAGLLF